MRILLVYEDSGRNYTAIHKSLKDGFPDAVKVDVLEYTEPVRNKLLLKVVSRIKPIENRFLQSFEDKLLHYLISNSFDCLVIIKGNFLRYSFFERIKNSAPKLKIINFNPDNPFNSASSSQDVKRTIKFYDLYCVYSRSILPIVAKAGCKLALYVPFGVDAKRIYPVQSNQAEHDITFIGNGDRDREAKLEELFSTRSFQISVFGNNWRRDDFKLLYPQVNGKAFMETIGRSKINVNILRRQNEGSTNMRTFEIPAAGGFMLHEYSEEAMEFFRPDEEAVYYNSASEFNDKVDFYLKNTAARERIRRNGYERSIQASCSYHARVKDILNAIQNG